MPNCLIVHGCPGDDERDSNAATRTYDKHWLPWATAQLNTRGLPTEITLMPEPWRPSYVRFKQAFEKYHVDENTTLIGTSCGCAFLVRWLGETKQQVRKLVLVAPWKLPETEDAEEDGFYSYPIDRGVAGRVGEIIYFTADNEEDAGKESLRIFHDALGGRIIDLPGHGHYTMGDMGTEEFPELITAVLS